MTENALIAEGQRLAKPCVYLIKSSSPGAQVAALWKGEGIVSPPDGPYKHWLSIAGSVLPVGVGPLPGVLSIYTNEEDEEAGIFALDPDASLPTNETDSLVLIAQPALSLPPIDAVFKFGSPAVRDWLAENDWLPDNEEDEADYAYNDNFPDRAVADAYERVWQDQFPLYTGSAFAVLGGWHFPWPDGDWHDLLKQTLIICTFEDSEPWIEVWRDANQTYTVLERIT